MDSQKRKVITAVLLLTSIAAFASMEGWKLFRSSNGFEVIYPDTWYRRGASDDTLRIFSSNGVMGGIGIIIKRGQAAIFVSEEQDTSTNNLAQVIDYYTRDSSVILPERDISGMGGEQGCRVLKEVTFREAVVPKEDIPQTMKVPYFIRSVYFCEFKDNKIVTLILTNWEGDTRQLEYQEVALRMAKSIRGIKQ